VHFLLWVLHFHVRVVSQASTDGVNDNLNPDVEGVLSEASPLHKLHSRVK